jgi:hypothetical protein
MVSERLSARINSEEMVMIPWHPTSAYLILELLLLLLVLN